MRLLLHMYGPCPFPCIICMCVPFCASHVCPFPCIICMCVPFCASHVCPFPCIICMCVPFCASHVCPFPYICMCAPFRASHVCPSLFHNLAARSDQGGRYAHCPVLPEATHSHRPSDPCQCPGTWLKLLLFSCWSHKHLFMSILL
jgi:hypothetical protein